MARMRRPFAWRVSLLRVADLDRVRDHLAEAVREAGAIALKTFKAPLKSWNKAGASPVSEADIAVDEMLRERLMGPQYAWLSEESLDNPARLQATDVWIVDPIDGTRGYIAGFADWAISVAL